MITDEALAKFKRFSPEERRAFDRWLEQCAIVGSVLVTGLLAIAVAGLQAPESQTVSAPKSAASFQEQHALAHLEYLPVSQIEDLTHVFTADPVARAPLTVSSSDSTGKR